MIQCIREELIYRVPLIISTKLPTPNRKKNQLRMKEIPIIPILPIPPPKHKGSHKNQPSKDPLPTQKTNI